MNHGSDERDDQQRQMRLYVPKQPSVYPYDVGLQGIEHAPIRPVT
jgi:hypothetical protein